MDFKYKDFADFLKQKNYGDVKDLTQEKAIEHQGEYFKEMREFQSDLQSKALNDQSEAMKTQLKEIEDRVKQTMNKQTLDMLESLKKRDEAIESLLAKGVAIDVQLTPFEKSIEDNMENIKAGKELPHSDSRTFTVSEKANFTAASVTNNTDALRLSDIGQLATRRLSVWDSLPKIPVPANANGTVRYTDWDQNTIARAAATLAEGGTFPESEATFEEYSISLKKIGDSIPITEESLYDRARFAAELRMFLETNVNLIVDNQCLNGDNTGNNLKGFNTTATTYVPVSSGISDASIYDLIVKMKEAMTADAGSKYVPNVAYMNITDINKYKLKKDANENYIMPPFVNDNGSVIDGVTIIETNAIAANTMVIADSRFIRVYEQSGIMVSTGVVGDQFKQDLITLKAKRRAQVLVREADRGGVYKSTDIAANLVTLAS